jgi:hypothetical protein
MRNRTLTRRIIIREYDFNRVRDEAFSVIMGEGSLYDRAEFTPMSNDTLEKLKLVELLKGKRTQLSQAALNLEIPALTLYQLKDYLYSEKYCQWKVTIDEDGYLCVQARKNTPKSRIGWGVFEKDYSCRI